MYDATRGYDSKLALTNLPVQSALLVKAKATYFQNFVRLYIPHEPYLKHKEEYERPINIGAVPQDIQNFQKLDKLLSLDRELEPIESIDLDWLLKWRDLPKPPKKPNELYIESSIRRTRKKIEDYTFCNKFDLLATFTFDKSKVDRQDVKQCKSTMANWLKSQQKRTGKFEYLIVPEYHKDNKSLHFHALIKGYKGRIKRSISSKTGKALSQNGRAVYELPSYRSGFTNVKIIDNEKDTDTKVAFYIQKYITKDMPLIFGKNRYWVSRGLKTPSTEDNPEEWYKSFEPDRSYDNDFGQIFEFDYGKHTLIDIFIEAYRP